MLNTFSPKKQPQYVNSKKCIHPLGYIKQLVIKNTSLETEIVKHLEVSGEGVVTAADIDTGSDIEIVNPDLVIAHLDSEDASLNMELHIKRGSGYVSAERNKQKRMTAR